MRDALVASVTFDIFNSHSDRLKIACIAQMVNVLQAVCLTDKEKMILTPTYHVFNMYKNHQEALPLITECENIPYITVDSEEIKAVSSSISESEDGSINISLTNISLSDDYEVEISINGMNKSDISASILSAKMDDYNTFDNPDNVCVKDYSGYTVSEDTITVKLLKTSIINITVK